MARLDLGGGHAPTPGHINIDLVPEATIQWNLNEGLPKKTYGELMNEVNNVEGIRCHQLIEHLDTIIPLMNDCYRAMLPDALFEISTPYAGTIQWYQDPTHKRAYVPESFLYFVDNSPFKKEQEEYGITARFEIVQAERGKGVDAWQLFVVLKKPNINVVNPDKEMVLPPEVQMNAGALA